jgi:hypothetical protein
MMMMMTMNTIAATSDAALVEALANATRAQREQIASIVGIPVKMLDTRWATEGNTHHLAGWIRKEISRVLGIGATDQDSEHDTTTTLARGRKGQIHRPMTPPQSPSCARAAELRGVSGG